VARAFWSAPARSLARSVTVADAQSRSSSTSIALTISAGGGVTKISAIQGTISNLYNLTRFASGATVTVLRSGHALPATVTPGFKSRTYI